MTRERTLQQRDPLAALVAVSTSYLAVVIVPLFAIVSTVWSIDEIANRALATLAIFLTILAAVVLAAKSSPLRAPLTSRTFILVVTCAVLAHLTSTVSMWTTNDFGRDDWGPVVIGLYFVALAPYRPAKELAIGAVVVAVVVAASVAVEAQYLDVAPFPLSVVVIAVTPVLAMGLAAAAFADVLVRSLDCWSVSTSRAFSAMTDQRGESIARSVQQDRITILNQEVVPFFAAILDGETVTEETRERAREIAGAIRSIMVAEADQTWLDAVVDDAARLAVGGTDAVSAVLRDDERLAEHMSPDQRTALRALLVAMHRDGGIRPADSSIEVTANGRRCEVLLRVAFERRDDDLRAAIAPFLAVMRVVFTDLHVASDPAALTLRFSYEQR